MHSIVVYDSQYGNTARVAQAVASVLEASGPTRAVQLDPAHQPVTQGIDLLVIGSPTQGFRPTQQIQTWLNNLNPTWLMGRAVACFDTRFRGWMWKNSAAPKMAAQLRKLGAELLVPPESFFVQSMKSEGPLLPGEVERASNWARLVAVNMEALHLMPL